MRLAVVLLTAERVDLPRAARDGILAEVLAEELVAAGGLVDHLDVEGRGLLKPQASSSKKV